jgi:hypothetical protein
VVANHLHHPEDGWLAAPFTGAMTLTSNLVWPGDYAEALMTNVGDEQEEDKNLLSLSQAEREEEEREKKNRARVSSCKKVALGVVWARWFGCAAMYALKHGNGGIEPWRSAATGYGWILCLSLERPLGRQEPLRSSLGTRADWRREPTVPLSNFLYQILLLWFCHNHAVAVRGAWRYLRLDLETTGKACRCSLVGESEQRQRVPAATLLC